MRIRKKIIKLSENLFLFIYLIEGDEIKENDFSYQVSNKYIFSRLSGPKTNDKIKPTLPGLSAPLLSQMKLAGLRL